jgi:hypothetical protein
MKVVTAEQFAAELALKSVTVPEAAKAVLMSSAMAMGAEMSRTAPSSRVAGSVTVRDDRKRGVQVGPTHPLGHLFEFGTGPRYRNSGGYTGIMGPRPFVWPAVDRLLPDMWRNLERLAGL